MLQHVQVHTPMALLKPSTLDPEHDVIMVQHVEPQPMLTLLFASCCADVMMTHNVTGACCTNANGRSSPELQC